jgi:hypothetical protein
MCTKFEASHNDCKPAARFDAMQASSLVSLSVVAPTFQDEHSNPPMRACPRDTAGGLATAPELDEDTMAQSDDVPKASTRIGPRNSFGSEQGRAPHHRLAMFALLGMAQSTQEHGNDMARARQGHGNNVAMAWPDHDKIWPPCACHVIPVFVPCPCNVLATHVQLLPRSCLCMACTCQGHVENTATISLQ